MFNGRAGREAIARLHRLRIQTHAEQVALAEDLPEENSTVDHGMSLQGARDSLEPAEKAYSSFCKQNAAACKVK